jgi:hypothetical protein
MYTIGFGMFAVGAIEAIVIVYFYGYFLFFYF